MTSDFDSYVPKTLYVNNRRTHPKCFLLHIALSYISKSQLHIYLKPLLSLFSLQYPFIS